MSDKLEWRNRHAVLLREPQWAGLAARENYKIRADLRPLFEANPSGEDLLSALAERKLHREGCEFLARMMHRRAAVWWGYCCLMALFEERQAVESGMAARPVEPFELKLRELAGDLGIELPDLSAGADNLDALGKAPDLDYAALLATPRPPAQDETALNAAADAVRAKAAHLSSLVPPDVRTLYARTFDRLSAEAAQTLGRTPQAALEEALAHVKEGPLTYAVERANSPKIKSLLELKDMLETMRQGTIAQIKAAFPEKYPATPEAAALLKAEENRLSDEAVQAVWRWIVAPDERNTSLALAAGNAAAQKPEGMLAYAAAWSFGDLAPEGQQFIPVPPELPGTGLNSALLMMALASGGTRKMGERYEQYFSLGLDVVRARNLWPGAVEEELSPHARLAAPPTENPPSASPASPAYRRWRK